MDWIVSFGAQTGFLHRLVSYFNPEARFDDFVHEGAHHLLGSLAFDSKRCPVWLRNLTIEPPESKWGIGESLRKNHAALYEEVLANYISYSGDAERAVKKTISTYPHQWHNQFVSRFDVAKSLPAERVIIALQKLTEMYPGFTWLQLENLNDSTEAIVKILKEL